MPEAPPAPLVTFRTFSSPVEADLAQSLLAAFGVACVTNSDDGIRLMIHPEDRERAEEIFAVQAEG